MGMCFQPACKCSTPKQALDEPNCWPQLIFDINIWPHIPLSELQVRRVVNHSGAAAVHTLPLQTEAVEKRRDGQSNRLFVIYSWATFSIFNDWFNCTLYDFQCFENILVLIPWLQLCNRCVAEMPLAKIPILTIYIILYLYSTRWLLLRTMFIVLNKYPIQCVWFTTEDYCSSLLMQCPCVRYVIYCLKCIFCTVT